VSYDRHTGRPRGFGFVVFADPIIADKVVAQQHTIDRREVSACFAPPHPPTPHSRSTDAIAEEQRRCHRACSSPHTPNTHPPYMHIPSHTLPEPSCAACPNLNTQVEAKKALPKEESPVSKDQQAMASGQRTKKIFVGGLAPSVEEEHFRRYFEEFGGVEDAVVMYDHENKRPRGFGFVTFAGGCRKEACFLFF
jgi:RNA recognition motif-containing protein